MRGRGGGLLSWPRPSRTVRPPEAASMSLSPPRFVSAPAACFVPLDARFMLARFATTWETHPTARAPSVGAPMRSNVGTEDEKGALRGICATGGAGHEGEDARRAGASLERVLGDNAGVRAERFEQRSHVLGRA